MSIQIDKEITLTAPTADYFAAAVTGDAWSLTNNSTPENVAYRVLLENLSATDHSAKNWTIVGKDADGLSQTETLAMPGSLATVNSSNYYSYVESITPSATIGVDTMNISYVNQSVTPSYLIDYNGGVATMAIITFETIQYTGQYSLSNMDNSVTKQWLDVPSDSDIYQKTTSNAEAFVGKPTALRNKIDTFTGTQVYRIQITQ